MSAIYMINTNQTTVQGKSIIPIYVDKAPGGNPIYINNSAIARKPGYYNINVNVTFTAAEAGDIEIVLQKNGANIPSFTATETITTADTETRTISFNGIIRVLCHEGEPVLTLFNNSNIAITTTNVAVSIVY